MFTFLRLMLTAAQVIGAVVFAVLIALVIGVFYIAGVLSDADTWLSRKTDAQLKYNAGKIFDLMEGK